MFLNSVVKRTCFYGEVENEIYFVEFEYAN